MPSNSFPDPRPRPMRGGQALLHVKAKCRTYAQDADLSIIVGLTLKPVIDAVRRRSSALTLKVMIHPAHQSQGIIIAAGRAAVAVSFARIQHQAHRWRIFLQL